MLVVCREPEFGTHRPTGCQGVYQSLESWVKTGKWAILHQTGSIGTTAMGKPLRASKGGAAESLSRKAEELRLMTGG